MSAQDRLVHRRHEMVGQLLAQFKVLGSKVQGVGGSPELHEGHDGVQPVGVFVGLGPQGVGQGLHGFEFTAQGLDFRPVAERGNGAEHGRSLPAPHPGRAHGGRLVHHQDPGSCEMDFVVCRPAGREEPVEAGLQGKVRKARCGSCGGIDVGPFQSQQIRGLVVVHDHTAACVDQDHAFADRVQDRLVVREQLRQLLRSPAPGDRTQVPAQQP